MTREEILKLEGRELDADVAEKVMGWSRKTATDGATEYWDNGTFCGGKWVEPVTGGFKLDDYSNTWNPSESIAAAWEVVEKMGQLGWMLYKTAHTLSGAGKVDGYICIYLHIETGASREVTAYIAPEAICKAALLAVMEATP